jgi:hypothetical protein
MRGHYKFATLFILCSQLSGCSFLYDVDVDPGSMVPVESVLKSLRCELVTFFEVNRLRINLYEYHLKKRDLDFKSNFLNYAYMDLDPERYGTLDVTLKTIDSLGLALGIDWKTQIDKSGAFHDWHFGPGLAATKTYNREVVFAVPQDGRLGPDVRTEDGTVPPHERSPLADPEAQDRDFFCFLQKDNIVAPPITTETINKASAALQFLEKLARHELPELENFQRIWVDGTTPLAEWLEKVSAETAKGFFSATQYPYTGAIIPGQVNYSFGLEVKPSVDLKFTLIATVINPEVPDVMISRDNTGTFQMFLNNTHAAAAFGGKQGTATIPRPQKSAAWGPLNDQTTNTTTIQPAYSPSAAPAAPKQSAPSTYGTRSPGYRLEAPLPLPLPPPAGQ